MDGYRITEIKMRSSSLAGVSSREKEEEDNKDLKKKIKKQMGSAILL
jgi:hypothetical protein